MAADLKTIKLRDRSGLSYAEYGHPQGIPIFHFHGWPGSRLGASVLDEPARKLKIRIIAPDRPGIGLSDFKKNRTLLDWPDDVVELADALHLKKFGILGVSGVVPYVLSCAYKIPDRLTKIGTVAGLAPIDDVSRLKDLSLRQKLFLNFAPRFTDLVWLELWFYKFILTYFPNLYRRYLLLNKPMSDKAVFSKPGVIERYKKSALESLRRVLRGAAWDVKIYSEPWGFDLKDIKIPVYLWHGDQDANVPVALAHFVAQRVPKCKATFYPEAGHALLAIYSKEILQTLI
jgi:pimeloyl-ACP methyl ester carboxylesterase